MNLMSYITYISFGMPNFLVLVQCLLFQKLDLDPWRLSNKQRNILKEWCVMVCKTMQLISRNSLTWNICVDIDSRKENGILWIIDWVSKKYFVLYFALFISEILFFLPVVTLADQYMFCLMWLQMKRRIMEDSIIVWILLIRSTSIYSNYLQYQDN